ncbi:MAG: hypothetical protein IT443_03540 [Phycisphaeraceae bacterium]|nr:hypothetical protein [Phycisphaeraceae bacterium]
MKTWCWLCCAFAVLIISFNAWALLSDNVIQNGDFESLSGLKLADSPRTQAEIAAGANPVRSWQFHPGGIAAEGPTSGQYFTDLGKWIAPWGISTYDDPRAAYNLGDNSAPNNRSIVTRNGQQTGVMEGALFRGWVTQVVAAPVGHTTGTAVIDFDYWFNQWETTPDYGDSILHVWIGGFNEGSLPSWDDRAMPIFGGSQADLNTMGATPLWDSPDWNTTGWSGIGSEKPDIGSQGLDWHTLSMDNPGTNTFEITTSYDYYYISAWLTVYIESHPYFWLYGGRPTDTMAAAIDNVSLQLPMIPEPTAAATALIGACALLAQRRR